MQELLSVTIIKPGLSAKSSSEGRSGKETQRTGCAKAVSQEAESVFLEGQVVCKASWGIGEGELRLKGRGKTPIERRGLSKRSEHPEESEQA